MKITTNNQPRLLIYWYDLTPTEKDEFDYMENPEDHSFFRYRSTH